MTEKVWKRESDMEDISETIYIIYIYIRRKLDLDAMAIRAETETR